MTKEEINAEARRLAGLCFSDQELALVLDLDAEEVAAQVLENKTPLARAINAGRLLIKAEVNHSVLKLAIRGSSPAQQAAMDMLKRLGL